MAPPTLKPTKAKRRRVELMAGEFAEDMIARMLGISRGTLRKHFADELDFGRARVLTQQLERLDRASAKGNVAAARTLMQRKDQTPPAKASAPKVAALGKKDAADLGAQTAEQGTGWSGLVN